MKDKKTWMKKGILLLMVIAVFAGLRLLLLKKAAHTTAPVYGQRSTPVRTATSRRGDLVVSRTYLAVAVPRRQVFLSSRVHSVVEAITLREGDSVSNQQVIITLDAREVEQGLAAAIAQAEQIQEEIAANRALIEATQHALDYAEREGKRYQKLSETKAVSLSALEKITDTIHNLTGQRESLHHKTAALQQQYNSLSHRVEELRVRRTYYELRSPCDGVIAERLVDAGDAALIGSPLITIEQTNTMVLQFDVPQQDLSSIRTGQPIQFGLGNQTRTASITRIFPSLNSARMLTAEVDIIPEQVPDLRNGSTVPLTLIQTTLTNVTLIPADALVQAPGQQPHVFSIEHSKLKAVPVIILGQAADEAALSGLPPGVSIVRSSFLGWARLSSGLNVEAVTP